MKNLFDKPVYEEVMSRLNSITPQSQRKSYTNQSPKGYNMINPGVEPGVNSKILQQPR